MFSFYAIVFFILSIPAYFIVRRVLRGPKDQPESFTKRYDEMRHSYDRDLTELKHDAEEEQKELKKKEQDIAQFKDKTN